MIWIIITIIHMKIVIHISSRPLWTRILLTQHIIILTNQVCRVGLIRINISPSLNTMSKTGKPSPLFIESVGIQFPWVIQSTTLPTSSFIYFFSQITIRRINWLGKEDKILRRACATNSNSRRLKIPSKFLNERSLLYFSRRTYRLRKEYEIHDSIPKCSYKYDRSKT